MITLYNVISADGFIARDNGEEDFIPDEVWVDFLDMCKNFEIVVMGRKTYETIQSYPEKMIKEFEDVNIKKVVITNNPGFEVKGAYHISQSPRESFSLGERVLLTSGPTLNTSVLSEGLIDTVVLNTLPEKIGSGIKVFNVDPKLELIKTEEKDSGRKMVFYKVIK